MEMNRNYGKYSDVSTVDLTSPRTRSYTLKTSSHSVCVIPKSLVNESCQFDSIQFSPRRITNSNSFIHHSNSPLNTKYLYQSNIETRLCDSTEKSSNNHACYHLPTQTVYPTIESYPATIESYPATIESYPTTIGETTVRRGIGQQTVGEQREINGVYPFIYKNQSANQLYGKDPILKNGFSGLEENNSNEIKNHKIPLKKTFYQHFDDMVNHMKISKNRVLVRKYAKGSCSSLNLLGVLDEENFCGCLNLFGCFNRKDQVTFLYLDSGQEIYSPFNNFKLHQKSP